jgi:FMN phosphatase YigB (HAD superfamily)
MGSIPVPARFVLFDIGGVLTVDPWQALLLTPGRGVADRLRLDREAVERVGDLLWPRYSLEPTAEAEYWDDVQRALGVEIGADVVRAAEADTLIADPSAGAALKSLDKREIRWTFISDNTSFWYSKQLGLLGGQPPSWPAYLSFERGVSKTSQAVGLFELAASELDPEMTTVVDDRAHNLARAVSCGFRAVSYSMGGVRSLLDVLED